MLVGWKDTVGIAAIGIFFSVFLGTLLAVLRLSPIKWLHYPAVVYIEVVRSVPLILFIFFVYFLIAGMGYNISSFSSASVAVVVFISTYIAEIVRSEEHTSELQSLMRISYAVFCLKKKKKQRNTTQYKYTRC